MNPQLPTLSGTRLHLWIILREAITFPWQYRHALWKWVLACGVFIGLMDYASSILDPDEMVKERNLWEVIYTFVFAMLFMVLGFSLYTVFCIRCHRLILLGSTTDADVFPPPLGEREGNFCLFLLIVYGSIFSVFFFGAVFGTAFLNLFGSPDAIHKDWPFLTLLMIPLSYLFGRSCMIFPAFAIDLQPTFRWCWDQSRAFAWRLGVIAGLLPWILSFLYNYNDDLARRFFGLEQFPFVYALVNGMLSFVCTSVVVAILSIAFRELSGLVSQDHGDADNR